MHHDDPILLRRLHGELSAPEICELEKRLAQEPALARRAEELAALWGSLEGPPMPAHDRDLTQRVVAAVRGPEQTLPAPAWARAGAVAVLLLGTWLGFRVAPVADFGSPSAVVASHTASDFDSAGFDTVDFDTVDFDIARIPLGDLPEGEISFEDLTLEDALASVPSLAESFWLDGPASDEDESFAEVLESP